MQPHNYSYLYAHVGEGSLEAKLPTTWTDESRDGKSQRREEERRSKRESLRRKKIQAREKVGKSRNTCVFQWFVAPEARKVGSLKRRLRSYVVRWEMKNCMPMWREAPFQVKMYKAHHVRTCSDHFWKLTCRKSERGCGAKHIPKSKC